MLNMELKAMDCWLLISRDCTFSTCGWTAERQEGWMALMEQSERNLIRQWNASATLSFHLIYIQIPASLYALNTVETKWQLELFKNPSLL